MQPYEHTQPTTFVKVDITKSEFLRIMSNTHTELQRLLAEGDHQGAWELIENEIVSMVNEDDQQGIQNLISSEVGRMVTEGNLQITGDAARRVQDLAIRLMIPIETEDERQHHPE